MSNLIEHYSKNERCLVATVELCTTCNWRCRHCYIPNHDCAGFSNEGIKELLCRLKDFGVYEVDFTGGEIFSREDCIEIIRYAREKGFAVDILSNASLLSDEIVNELAKCNIEFFDCTIFSMDSRIHDWFVQKDGAFDLAISNILKLREKGINVKMKCILTKYNWSSYKDIMLFCKEHDIEYLFTLDLYKRNNGDDLPLKMRVPEKYIEKVISDISVDNGISYEKVTEDDYICRSSRYGLFISATGDVQPCGNYKKRIGNVNDDSLASLWDKEEYIKVRNMRVKDTEKCTDCKLKKYCFSCPGINELEGYTSLGCREFDLNLAKVRMKCFG